MRESDYYAPGSYRDPNEIWKPVPLKEFENLYEISNYGKVRSKGTYNTCKKGIMNPMTDTSGYYHVRLYNKGISKDVSIHKLVALAFILNPDNLPMVNHIDEDKTNNHVENLEWCTNQYNIRYSNAKAIDVYTKDGEFIETLEAISDAVSKYEIETSSISRCCKSRYRTCKGYQFRYHGEPFSKKPFVFTEYQRRKSRRGHNCNERKYIPINVYSTTGDFIKTYKNLSQAADACGTTTGNICKCYRGELLTNKGYIFLLDNNIEARIQQLNNRKHKSKSEKNLYEL
jgi:hypothetical protein